MNRNGFWGFLLKFKFEGATAELQSKKYSFYITFLANTKVRVQICKTQNKYLLPTDWIVELIKLSLVADTNWCRRCPNKNDSTISRNRKNWPITSCLCCRVNQRNFDPFPPTTKVQDWPPQSKHSSKYRHTFLVKSTDILQLHNADMKVNFNGTQHPQILSTKSSCPPIIITAIHWLVLFSFATRVQKYWSLRMNLCTQSVYIKMSSLLDALEQPQHHLRFPLASPRPRWPFAAAISWKFTRNSTA